MTNWPLIGPAPFTSWFNEQVQSAASTGYLLVNRDTQGDTWIEYSASWPHTTNFLRIEIDTLGTKQGSVFIGIGGSGSERAILEFPGTQKTDHGDLFIELPITIRAGERVSIKPTSAASGDIRVKVSGYNDPLFRTDLRYSDLMGVTDVNSLTVPDPGGTIHTKDAWLEIKDVTANDYKALVLLFQGENAADTTDVDGLFDIAVGAASSEIIIIPDLWVRRRGRWVSDLQAYFFIPAHLPAGVRLAVRCQADNITLGIRNLTGVAIIGLY